MFLLDSTIVNPALATIQRELHFSTSSLAWVVNGYTLMAGGFLIVGGRVADLLGRRRRHDRTTSSRGMGCASGHVDFSSARTTCW
jgi:MFS family permease